MHTSCTTKELIDVAEVRSIDSSLRESPLVTTLAEYIAEKFSTKYVPPELVPETPNAER